MKPLAERSYAFVVKIWEERRDVADAGPMWRGSVEDVQSRDRHYFNSLPELSTYLQQRSGMNNAPRRTNWLLALIRRS